MKIISLFIRNIQALKGEHKIDFASGPLSEAGLFAITGPTGAGKSTLLDAICLALYNEVPRFGKISKSVIQEKGAILAKNTMEATAEVVYETSKGQYRATWSIRHNRNQTLEDYHMSIVHMEKNEILDLKKSQVPDKNAELIGLNFNQFLRAVVLSQGQFAKFLQAKHTERSELLERMTGGQIYRELSAYCYKYYQKIQEEYLKIQEQQQQLELLGPEQRIALENDMLAWVQNRDHKQHELQKITEALQLVDRYQKLQESLSNENKLLTELESQKSDIEEKKCAITQHEKIQPLLSELKLLRLYQEEWKTTSEKCEKLKIDIQRLQFEQENQKAELNPLNPDQTPWLEWFLKKEEEMLSLKAEIDWVKAKEDDVQQEINAFFAQRGEPAKSLWEKSLEDLQQLHIQFSTTHQTRPWYGQTGEQLSATRTDLTETQKSTEELLKIAEKRAEWLGKLESLNQQREKLVAQIGHYDTQERELEKETRNLQDNLSELRNKLPYYEVISLRDSLVPATPCPVCGSLEHPSAHEALPDLSTMKEIEQNLFNHTEALQKLQKEKAIFIGNQGFLDTEVAQLDVSLKTLEETPDLTTLTNQKNTHSEAIESLDRFREEQQKLQSLNKLIELKSAVQAHTAKNLDLQARLKTCCPSDKPVLWIREQNNKWKERQIHLQAKTGEQQTLLQELSQRHNKWETAQVQVIEKVQLAGFSGIEEVQAQAIPMQQAEAIKASISDWEKRIQATQTRVEEKQKDLAQIPKDVAHWEPGHLEETRKNLAQEIHTLGEALGRIQAQLQQDEDRQKQFANLQWALQEKAAYRDRWGRLNDKIGSATGDKFSKMVQALHMERLLWLANTRLSQMTPRYRFVTRRNDVSLSQSDDLFVEDVFMGGEIRAASTLSGGESFLTSLALALGLSDMAAGQIQLSCMFIDEGFGTLDGETLDMALDTLEKLQAESQKTIGIISHVQGLKERISTQIQLKPLGNGASTLEVVGPKGHHT
jgi:exonuclease SbcC